MPEHDGSATVRYDCRCDAGPWDARGCCEACGGINAEVATLFAPQQLEFATDDMLVERLKRIEDDAGYVRRQIERAP